jgi:peptidoglycan/LPS O-acetylase OafA/YrhL
MMTPRAHFPSLDGLRGIAAVAVIFNHLGPVNVLDGRWWLLPLVGLTNIGWIGVDLFFVLSGFLITGILLENKRRRIITRCFTAIARYASCRSMFFS